MTLPAWLVGWLAVAIFTPAAAAEIYRCGPNGSTYSQTPCADGHRVEIDDARSDEQRLQARQVNERTVALASSLERNRLANEAALRPALAGSFNGPVKAASNHTARSNDNAEAKAKAKAKAKTKRLRVPAQPSNRRASKPAPVVVLAQPRD